MPLEQTIPSPPKKKAVKKAEKKRLSFEDSGKTFQVLTTTRNLFSWLSLDNQSMIACTSNIEFKDIIKVTWESMTSTQKREFTNDYPAEGAYCEFEANNHPYSPLTNTVLQVIG